MTLGSLFEPSSGAGSARGAEALGDDIAVRWERKLYVWGLEAGLIYEVTYLIFMLICITGVLEQSSCYSKVRLKLGIVLLLMSRYTLVQTRYDKNAIFTGRIHITFHYHVVLIKLGYLLFVSPLRKLSSHQSLRGTDK